MTRIGIEHALAGHAAAFAATGAPAVKYLLDTWTRGKMQGSAAADVDFSVTDRDARELQPAGFAELIDTRGTEDSPIGKSERSCPLQKLDGLLVAVSVEGGGKTGVS